MITDEELDRLSQLSERCAPSRWFASVEGRDHQSGDSFIQAGSGSDRAEDIYVSRDSKPADAICLDLIAEARTFLPLLVSEIRELRALVTHLQENR